MKKNKYVFIIDRFCLKKLRTYVQIEINEESKKEFFNNWKVNRNFINIKGK
jgi:hypothetical protein